VAIAIRHACSFGLENTKFDRQWATARGFDHEIEKTLTREGGGVPFGGRLRRIEAVMLAGAGTPEPSLRLEAFDRFTAPPS
jgi:hypothetical protein